MKKPRLVTSGVFVVGGECDFASWYKPVAQKCPNCESKYMVEKDTKKDGLHFYCPECKHKLLKQAEPVPVTGV